MPKNPAAQALGALGGKARANKLTPERRKEIAAMGAAKREANKKKQKTGENSENELKQ